MHFIILLPRLRILVRPPVLDHLYFSIRRCQKFETVRTNCIPIGITMYVMLRDLCEKCEEFSAATVLADQAML